VHSLGALSHRGFLLLIKDLRKLGYHINFRTVIVLFVRVTIFEMEPTQIPWIYTSITTQESYPDDCFSVKMVREENDNHDNRVCA
jgi:hypothetical protein